MIPFFSIFFIEILLEKLTLLVLMNEACARLLFIGRCVMNMYVTLPTIYYKETSLLYHGGVLVPGTLSWTISEGILL
jgi:hypothetical protein